MKYIIMCGGRYRDFEMPKHLTPIHGEPLVARTIRLLRQNGVEDIAISSNDSRFEQFGVPVLRHYNDYELSHHQHWQTGTWLSGFYKTEDPVCYLFGDVVFSPAAIKTIVETETNDVEFFASTESDEKYEKNYLKLWAEPFAFKVQNVGHFWDSIELAKKWDAERRFLRHPVSWELWQVIKGTPLNKIDYTNYTAINDYTCDLDTPEEARDYENIIPKGD